MTLQDNGVSLAASVTVAVAVKSCGWVIKAEEAGTMPSGVWY